MEVDVETVVVIVGGVVAIASAVAAATRTKKDDRVVSFVKRVLAALAPKSGRKR